MAIFVSLYLHTFLLLHIFEHQKQNIPYNQFDHHKHKNKQLYCIRTECTDGCLLDIYIRQKERTTLENYNFSCPR